MKYCVESDTLKRKIDEFSDVIVRALKVDAFSIEGQSIKRDISSTLLAVFYKAEEEFEEKNAQ